VFHSAAPFFNFSKGEEILSEQMITYWTNFAHTGSPNKGNTVPSLKWPPYQQSANGQWPNMKFAVPSSIENNFDASYCNFWDKIGYNHGV